MRARRRQLGEVGEVCVPLFSEAGVEAEVDWGEAKILLRGELVDAHLFLMRPCFSGASFVMAFQTESQQAFLEAHVAAFEFFGGVFDLVRYDNLKAAVTRVLKGRRREQSDRFVAMRSHLDDVRREVWNDARRAGNLTERQQLKLVDYRYESSFCLSGQQGAHEKGGVEGEVGRFRRRHLVPVPEVDSMAEFNELLEQACWKDLERTITGHGATVGERLDAERRLLNTLPREPHDTSQQAMPRVDAKALATVRCNRYSVPASLAGLKVAARIGAGEIMFFHDGKQVACHERLAGKNGVSAQLDHYLELLQRKPGALARSLALRQQRDRGDWPACFDELWDRIAERAGRQEAARQMVDVLLLCREHPVARVQLAVQGALTAGAHDGKAVALLARQAQRPAVAALEVDAKLQGVGAPPPSNLAVYDALREAGS